MTNPNEIQSNTPTDHYELTQQKRQYYILLTDCILFFYNNFVC